MTAKRAAGKVLRLNLRLISRQLQLLASSDDKDKSNIAKPVRSANFLRWLSPASGGCYFCSPVGQLANSLWSPTTTTFKAHDNYDNKRPPSVSMSWREEVEAPRRRNRRFQRRA